jgi:hypothetical protein
VSARPLYQLQNDDQLTIVPFSEEASDAWRPGAQQADFLLFRKNDAGDPELVPVAATQEALDNAVSKGWGLAQLDDTEFQALVDAKLIDPSWHDELVSVDSRGKVSSPVILAPDTWQPYIKHPGQEPVGGPFTPVDQTVADTSTNGGGSTWVDYSGGGGRSGSDYRNDGSSYGGGGYGSGYGSGGYGDGDWYGVPAPTAAPMGYGSDWSSAAGDWMQRPAPWGSPIFDRYFATANSGWPFRRNSRGRFTRGRRGRVLMRPRSRSGPRTHAPLPADVAPAADVPKSRGEEALAAALALRGR